MTFPPVRSAYDGRWRARGGRGRMPLPPSVLTVRELKGGIKMIEFDVENDVVIEELPMLPGTEFDEQDDVGGILLGNNNVIGY